MGRPITAPVWNIGHYLPRRGAFLALGCVAPLLGAPGIDAPASAQSASPIAPSSASSLPPPPPDRPIIPTLPSASAEINGPNPSKTIVTAIQIANLPLGVVTFPNGKAINLHVGIGSAAFRQPNDALGRIWLLTDRGPNIACAEAKKLIGLDHEAMCAGDKAGRILPLVGFVPSIYGAEIGADMVARINVFIPLKGKSGKPANGRPNASLSAGGEAAFSLDGKPLPSDPSGIDPEALVRLADGSFWLAEDFGPSLLNVAADGTILKRLVPAGSEADYKDADYEVVPTLPAILRKRMPNRGIEALAISPDERFLYAMMQGALANPDVETGRNTRNIRLFKIERETGAVVAEHLYALDEPNLFRADNETRERRLHHVHISEMAALGEDSLIVLERIDKTTRLFRIALDAASRIPRELGSDSTLLSLEMLALGELEARGIAPMRKTLVLDSDDLGGLPAKIQGMAVLGPREIILINDNDFGIDGVRTQMFRVTLPAPLVP